MYAVQWGSTVDNAAQTASFYIVFNESPDFFTVDAYGRQADSFQYFIEADSTAVNYYRSESLIRGGEIYVDGDIDICTQDAFGYSGSECGGWGPYRGSVSYQLSGDTLWFTVPWELMNLNDGQFSYLLEFYEFGRWNANGDVFGLSGATYPGGSLPPPSIPIPAAAWLFGSAFGVLIWVRRTFV